jgi:hypothetical protein
MIGVPLKKFEKILDQDEVRYGFLYLDPQHHKFLPNMTSKIKISFEGHEVLKDYTYNAESNRVIGISGWLSDYGIKVGERITIHVDKEGLRIEKWSEIPFSAFATTENTKDDTGDEDVQWVEAWPPYWSGHDEDSLKRRRVVALFLFEYHKIFTRMISRFFPLNEYLLEKYEDEWTWRLISMNENLPISENLLLRFSHRLNWYILSNRSDLPWSEDLIINFQEYWDWERLSENTSVPWTSLLLEMFEDKIFWRVEEDSYFDSEYDMEAYYPEKTICSNPHVLWDRELINKYIDKIDFTELCDNPSIKWKKKLISEFKDYIDWTVLCSGRNVKWSTSFLNEFNEFIDWESLSGNQYFNWNDANIEKYHDRIHWDSLALNPQLKISIECIKENIDSFNWQRLCANSGIFTSDFFVYEFLKEFNENIDWRSLSSNTAAVWTYLGDYVEYWDWGELSRNPDLEWDSWMIKEYKDKIDWHRLSGNRGVQFDDDLVIENATSWDWERLLENEEFHLNTHIAKKCKNYINKARTMYFNNFKIAEYAHSDYILHMSNSLRANDLSDNELAILQTLPWSMRMITRYIDFENELLYDMDGISGVRHHGLGLATNRMIWERVFKPFTDEVLIEEVIYMYNKRKKK